MEMHSMNVPDWDPQDVDYEDLKEMGVQSGFFMLGQIRAHEIAQTVNIAQLCAACGLAPTEANFGPIMHEIRGKCIRVENERRKGSTFERCLRSAEIDRLGPAVFGYSNGFHTALGQLAKILTMRHIRDSNQS